MTDDEWERWVKQVRANYNNTGQFPPAYGPVTKPPSRLSDLNPELRMILGEMTAEDARALHDALRFYRTAGVLGKFLRWVGFALLFAIGGMAAFGDHIANLWRFMFLGTPK